VWHLNPRIGAQDATFDTLFPVVVAFGRAVPVKAAQQAASVGLSLKLPDEANSPSFT